MRSSSRSSHKDVAEENGKKQEKQSNILSFKRSLKLLGFQPEDFNVKENDFRKSQISRVSPTFFTKLRKRSSSLTSLRNAVSLPPEVLDQYKRETLAKAVYEEWYFKKLELERRKKETNERKEKQRKEVLEKEEEERRLKAEYYFSKWLQLKREEKKREKSMLSKTRSNSELLKQSVDKERAEAAFRLWKAEKDKLYQIINNPKVKKEREEREKAEKEEKKRIAEAAFRAWKESVDMELKEKLKEKELHMKSEEERKQREIEERRQNALSSFVAWKEMKDNEVKQKLKEKRLAAEAAERIEKTHLAERAYEAEQAYEEWLDMIEERLQSKNTTAKRRKSLPTFPPWHPGGSVTKIC
ncbi:microtubule-associated protein 9 isoform X2 [Anabrus simplex]|uniref:microtubule-associated protein 9 isoform X2 n=1 Tax=Anabrus simplex TaxID=316456 RepID=UPI0035A296DE